MTIKSTLQNFSKLICIALLWNCALAWGAELEQIDPVTEPTTVFTRIQELKARASHLMTKAINFLGTRYKYGGKTAEQGLDCSRLVQLVFKDALDIDLPRTSIEISRAGEKIELNELQPGDLVFYNTLRRGFSHVGIYMGDKKFIHSPSSGGEVRIENMDLTYWKKRFNGARRINNY